MLAALDREAANRSRAAGRMPVRMMTVRTGDRNSACDRFAKRSAGFACGGGAAKAGNLNRFVSECESNMTTPVRGTGASPSSYQADEGPSSPSHATEQRAPAATLGAQNTDLLGGLGRLPKELLLKIATDTPKIRPELRLTSRAWYAIANWATRELKILDKWALAAVLEGRYPALRSLDVSHIGIGDAAATALARNATLHSLNVGYNDIGHEGATALAGNTTLRSLDLSGNDIGDEGATALASNATLHSLALRLNCIGDEGAKALARNTTLRSLDVSNNGIGDEGAIALAGNTTLRSLDLRYNGLSPAVKAELQKLARESGRTILV
jgi:hypothetical protein